MQPFNLNKEVLHTYLDNEHTSGRNTFCLLHIKSPKRKLLPHQTFLMMLMHEENRTENQIAVRQGTSVNLLPVDSC